MLLFRGSDYSVTVNVTDEMKSKTFDAIFEWMKKHEYFNGESIQCDDFVISAPDLISDIIDDIIKPEVKYDEDI